MTSRFVRYSMWLIHRHRNAALPLGIEDALGKLLFFSNSHFGPQGRMRIVPAHHPRVEFVIGGIGARAGQDRDEEKLHDLVLLEYRLGVTEITKGRPGLGARVPRTTGMRMTIHGPQA